MKRGMIFSILTLAGLFFGASFAEEAQASNPEITKTKVERTEEKFHVNAAEFNLAEGKSEMASNCYYYWTYRYYTCYTYYYVPCYYTYSCVWYYNGIDDKTGGEGLLIDKAPEKGTALHKLGVEKGDIILKIDGSAVKSADDIAKITENSALSIAKTNSAPVPFGGASSVDEFLRN